MFLPGINPEEKTAESKHGPPKEQLMIKKLIYQSRATEVSDASSRMISMYQNAGLTQDTHLATIFGDLQTESDRLIRAIKRMKTESELEGLDEIRDGNIRSLHYLVLGLVHHPNPEINQPASVVYEVLEHYGLTSLITENYGSESSLIQSLLGDLAKPEIQEAAAKLSGFDQCVARLSDSQANFETARVAYEFEKARESNEVNATTLKLQLIELINQKLVTYLRAMQAVDAGTYGNFVNSIAEVIETTNEAVKRRRKKKKATA